MLANPFQALDNIALEQSLLKLAATERDVDADIILHLLVVKERRLYAPAGYDSLFNYCTGRLGFSRSTAYRRKAVVDKAEAFPELIGRLREGRLHLCAAATVAPHLELASATDLLDAVEGLSHREVETFLAKTWRKQAEPPKPAERPSSSVETSLKLDFGLEPVRVAASTDPHDEPGVTVADPAKKMTQRTVVRPVSADNSRVSVTLSDKTIENLRRAQELLGGRTDDDILFRALERLLDQIAPERRHARRQARSERSAEKGLAASLPEAHSETAPRTSRRGRIRDRDQAIVDGRGQCGFVADDGTRCGAKTFLEVDHIMPWALGGPSTVENQRPLCRVHNAYLAELTFGPWGRRRASSGQASPRP
jgi:hypothetical protein